MKALLYDRFGGPEVLRIADVPMPEPGPREVVVRVCAATVGIGDCKARAGLLQHFHALRLPKIPGRYGCGEIAAAGAQVDAVKVGDAVVFATLHSESGSAAEYVRLDAARLALKPSNSSFVETASFIQGAVCAHICLVEAGEVAAGRKVLVHGAAGSVGSACVELARHCGAVIAATCREIDRDYVIALGADRVIAFDREDFAAFAGGQDVVVDVIGGDVHRRCYGVLARGGRLIYLHADPIEDQEADNKGADYGITVVNAVIDNRAAVLDAVCRLAEQGVFTPKLGKVLPLAAGAEAHRLVETHAIKRGRVVLEIP
jgi:NADPH:quinone reductase-like Zn-dependent oxidoreductase